MSTEKTNPLIIQENSELISSWEDIQKIQKERKIYRGQKCSCYSFKTSLERLFEKISPYSNKKNVDIPILERALTAEFKRRFHQYSMYVPTANSNLEWLSLMQHCGAPTRLLDWTYSFYIALYFALEDAKEDAAVWEIDQNWLIREAGRKIENAYGNDLKTVLVDRVSFGKDFKDTFTEVFLEKSKKVNFIYLACPSRLTERMTVQKGMFLCPGNIEESFDVNLTAMKDWKQYVKRYVIKQDMKYEFLNKLYDMNIGRTSLFPGLDGFAQSLSIFHHIFRKKIVGSEKPPYEETENSKIIWHED